MSTRTGPDYDFFYYDFTAFFLRFYGVFLRCRYDASGAFTTLPSHVFPCFQAIFSSNLAIGARDVHISMIVVYVGIRDVLEGGEAFAFSSPGC